MVTNITVKELIEILFLIMKVSSFASQLLKKERDFPLYPLHSHQRQNTFSFR